MTTFEQLGLPAPLSAALAQMKYEIPTPIQAQAIPLALEGRDVLGSAQTGTGKTAAFSIPLIAKLIGSSRGSALVLTPTRELATQIMDIMKQLLSNERNIKCALLIGGESMPNQIRQLKSSPRIIIGTPGRINDHLERGTLRLHDANFLVLDETDRMLDMGFGVQLDAMFRYLPKVRQTLMFSATLPAAIVKLSEKYLTNPERVSAGEEGQPALNITQEVVHLSREEKYPRLLEELDKREGSILVFVKTKHGADKLSDQLQRKGYASEAIHGDLRQNRRNKVIQLFRDQKYRILVATDVVARGLDIPHIEHVINYDLPMAAEDYIHRIGRTARAGAEGSALCLITPDDRSKWRAIERLLDPTNKKDDGLYEGASSGGRGNRGSRPSGGRSGGGTRSFGGGRPSGNRPRSQEGSSRDAGSRDGERSYAPRGDAPRRDSSARPAREGGERSYAPKAEGDRPFRADRPKQQADRSDRPARDRDGERSYAPRDGAPRRDGGARPARDGVKRDGERSYAPRGEGSDRPYRAKREDGGNDRRPARDGERSYAPRDGAPRRDGGARPARDGAKRDGERSYAPRGESSDRPYRAKREDGGNDRRPARDGERSYAPRDGAPRRDGGARPARDGERSYAPRGENSDRPARAKREGFGGGDRPARDRDGERSYAPRDGAPRRDGGARPARDGERNDRTPPRTGGDKPFRGKRDGAPRDGARRDGAARPARDGARRDGGKPSRGGEKSERSASGDHSENSLRPRKNFINNRQFTKTRAA